MSCASSTPATAARRKLRSETPPAGPRAQLGGALLIGSMVSPGTRGDWSSWALWLGRPHAARRLGRRHPATPPSSSPTASTRSRRPRAPTTNVIAGPRSLLRRRRAVRGGSSSRRPRSRGSPMSRLRRARHRRAASARRLIPARCPRLVRPGDPGTASQHRGHSPPTSTARTTTATRASHPRAPLLAGPPTGTVEVSPARATPSCSGRRRVHGPDRRRHERRCRCCPSRPAGCRSHRALDDLDGVMVHESGARLPVLGRLVDWHDTRRSARPWV